MPLYENVFIGRQDLSEEQMAGFIKNYGAIVTARGGRVAKTEYWGLRSLAYKIEKNRKGHYGLLHLEAPREAVREMEEKMRLDENILRFLTVRMEAPDPDPSPPMRKVTDYETQGEEEGLGFQRRSDAPPLDDTPPPDAIPDAPPPFLENENPAPPSEEAPSEEAPSEEAPSEEAPSEEAPPKEEPSP